jgi:hypothetical protein
LGVESYLVGILVCYTQIVDDNHQIWEDWVYILHRLGIGDLIASLLESSGSLTMLGAQLVYIGQPILNLILPADQINALVGLLEDEEQRRTFITFLRQEN